ncbi:hypothetical protein EON79_02195 [bacterium]|nr:MAG: hypothetical protein EON79_02195 [bacterium]
MTERYLDPEEQARILARAADLQAAHRAGQFSPGHVTLGDLERAAMEKGLDPHFVRIAAQEPEPVESAGSPVFWTFAAFFAIIQFFAWSGMVNRMTSYSSLALMLEIPVTIALGILASRDRQHISIGAALIVGTCLSSVASMVAWRAGTGAQGLIVGAKEHHLVFSFMAQMVLFAISALIAKSFRRDRVSRTPVHRRSKPGLF